MVNWGGKYPEPPPWRFLLAFVDLAMQFSDSTPPPRLTEQITPLLKVRNGRLSDKVVFLAIAHTVLVAKLLSSQSLGQMIVCLSDSVESLALGWLPGHCLKHVRHDFRISLEFFSPPRLSYNLLSIVHNKLESKTPHNTCSMKICQNQQV